MFTNEMTWAQISDLYDIRVSALTGELILKQKPDNQITKDKLQELKDRLDFLFDKHKNENQASKIIQNAQRLFGAIPTELLYLIDPDDVVLDTGCSIEIAWRSGDGSAYLYIDLCFIHMKIITDSGFTIEKTHSSITDPATICAVSKFILENKHEY